MLDPVSTPPYCCNWRGSVIFTLLDSIIDGTKNTSDCAEIAETLVKGTLKPQYRGKISERKESRQLLNTKTRSFRANTRNIFSLFMRCGGHPKGGGDPRDPPGSAPAIITIIPTVKNNKKSWRKNSSSSSLIFLEITCWYWPLEFSWI